MEKSAEYLHTDKLFPKDTGAAVHILCSDTDFSNERSPAHCKSVEQQMILEVTVSGHQNKIIFGMAALVNVILSKLKFLQFDDIEFFPVSVSEYIPVMGFGGRLVQCFIELCFFYQVNLLSRDGGLLETIDFKVDML